MDKEFLTIKAFAEKIYYSERQVRQMCIDGKLAGAHKIPEGRKWLIPESALVTLNPDIKRPQEEPANSLAIQVREIGGTVVDTESGKSGQLVAFTLGNCSRNVLTVERICLEVLSCQSYDELPHIEARVIPVKYEVKLSPGRIGEYVVTEEKSRYEGPGADDFDLVCDAPPGFKYNIRLNIYYSDLATQKHFTLSSDDFDICFYKEGSPLSRYIHKGHARRLSQRD